MKERKVAITGVGLVTPLGNTKEGVVENLKRGVSAEKKKIFLSEKKSVSVFPAQNGFACAKGEDPFISFGLCAAHNAWHDAGLDKNVYDPWRMGIVVSSSKGGVSTFRTYYEKIGTTPTQNEAEEFFKNYFPSNLSIEIARTCRIAGPVKNISTACATGTHSIIEAVRLIEDDMAECVLAGASDASIDPLMLAGYVRMGAYGTHEICPFDQKRDGFLIGEGAGVVVLESEAHARARGAHIYCTIDRYAYGCEIGNPIHFNHNANALADLLVRICGEEQEAINYINMHATSTPAGDAYETEQVKRAFGDRAYQIPCSSTKGAMGHLLGASGAVECIMTALAMENNFLPPTVNLHEQDPACDLDYVPNHAREKKIGRALSLSMGFGGQIGIIALRK